MTPLRLLFISWSTTGGSGQSQRQLAAQLSLLGHASHFVVHDRKPAKVTRTAYRRLSNLSARLEGRPLARRVVAAARDLPGRRATIGEIDGFPTRWSPVPQNALARAIRDFDPHVVVASSVDRWAWRRIQATCTKEGIPSVLYIREEASLEHLETGSLPDLLVANTASLRARMEERGYICAFVPSVIDVEATLTTSSRQAALAINPIAIKGGDLVWELARRLPEIPFVVQEAWDLAGPDLEIALRHAEDLDNVEFRRRMPPGPALYREARVLLAPYRVDSRPRVILEAHSNGIPVVASNLPAMVDEVGDGGVALSIDSADAPERWVSTLRSLWEDEAKYAALSHAALERSRRPEVAPQVIAAQFVDLVEPLVTAKRVTT